MSGRLRQAVSTSTKKTYDYGASNKGGDFSVKRDALKRLRLDMRQEEGAPRKKAKCPECEGKGEDCKCEDMVEQTADSPTATSGSN